MSYATVEIEGRLYPVYADLDAADAYLNAATQADTWRGLDDTAKSRALVTATRTLDRQKWKGTMSDPNQLLAWPRDNVNCPNAEDGVIPENIITASIEMASALVDGSDLQNTANQSQKIQTLRAGSVSITWFRGAEGFPQRFPQIITELLSCLLAGSDGAGLAGFKAFGTEEKSVTDRSFDHSQPI